MNEQLGDEIYSHFATNHIKLQREWFKDVLNYLQTLTNDKVQMIDLLFHQWIFTDIQWSTEPNSSSLISNNNNLKHLPAPCIFQIQSIVDVGTSNLKQYKRLIEPDYDESAAELGVDGFENLNPNKGYKCFSLMITDGKNNFKAVEKRRIPDLTASTCPGCKILILGSAKMEQGIIFLTPESCHLLGGAVEKLMDDNNILKHLTKQLNKPNPAKPLATAHIQNNGIPPRSAKPAILAPQTTANPIRKTEPTVNGTAQQITANNSWGKHSQQRENVAPPSVMTQRVDNSNFDGKASQPIIPSINNTAEQQQHTNRNSQKVQAINVASSHQQINGRTSPSLLDEIPSVVHQQMPFGSKAVNANAADGDAIRMYKQLDVQSLSEIAKKMAFSVGSKRFNAIVVEQSSPFHIVDDKWTMQVVLQDDSQCRTECVLSHEFLSGLIGMTPQEAMEIKRSGSEARKTEGAERVRLMHEQLFRLDLMFEIEFRFRQKPIVHSIVTLPERLGII